MDTTTTKPANGQANGHVGSKPAQKRGPPLHQIYALPAPIKTFPLPVFYPNNPISIFHILYTWLGQVFRPPPTEPSVVHQATWSEATISVHITDEKSMRALWEQGFYGKGSLSRSEPNWLKREQVRRGLEKAHVSELQTLQRREERSRAKWERARLEQEAIRQTRLEEAERKAKAEPASTDDATVTVQPEANPATITAEAIAIEAKSSLPLEADTEPEPIAPVESRDAPIVLEAPVAPISPKAQIVMLDSTAQISVTRKLAFCPPVGPLELLALPNSDSDSESTIVGVEEDDLVAKQDAEAHVDASEPIPVVTVLPKTTFTAPTGPLELLSLPNSNAVIFVNDADKLIAISTPQSEPQVEIQEAAVPSRPELEPAFLSPVGPSQLLALPNSTADVIIQTAPTPVDLVIPTRPSSLPPTGPLQLLALPNSDVAIRNVDDAHPVEAKAEPTSEFDDDHEIPEALANVAPSEKEELVLQGVDVDAVSGPATSESGLIEPVFDNREGMSTGLVQPQEVVVEIAGTKPNKTVRFSPDIDSRTIEEPEATTTDSVVATAAIETLPAPFDDNNTEPAVETVVSNKNGLISEVVMDEIVNKEHLQLMPEEAFFLSFGLGVLSVTDPLSGLQLSNRELLQLFRQHSYFPPRQGPDDPDLEPDDSFLLNYAVYHHFRSLGWVPRAGIKFGVDWLLYTRGPVFDHAEFGLVIIPSYTHPAWAGSNKHEKKKSWQWFHSVLRVLSHVMKSVVLVYVDVPPPDVLEAALDKGVAEGLATYQIREVMIKRWSSNRNR